MPRLRLGSTPLALGVVLACRLLSGQTIVPAKVVADRVPQFVDITARTGIHFNHLASPEQKYIVESMSGGVALLDFDRDGWMSDRLTALRARIDWQPFDALPAGDSEARATPSPDAQ